MADAAYLAALKLLSRRELSAAQVRQRLRRQGHSSDAIEGVIVRLVSDGSIDDRRVAGAIARTEVNIRRRGAHRVRRQIESAGIDTTIAQEALEEVFASVDPDVGRLADRSVAVTRSTAPPKSITETSRET